jgi:hypothetical protein
MAMRGISSATIWRVRALRTFLKSGDNGTGLGASHQTGWTGVIARTMHLFATTSAEQVLELGKVAAVIELDKPAAGRQTSVKPQSQRMKAKI